MTWDMGRPSGSRPTCSQPAPQPPRRRPTRRRCGSATSIPERPARSSWTSLTNNSRMGQPELAALPQEANLTRAEFAGGTPGRGPTRERPCPRSVSRLSAAIPRAASRRITALRLPRSLSRADAVPSNVAKGRVKGRGWHGMQEVRGSNPLSSTPAQRPSPPSTAHEFRRPRSRCAATRSATPRRASRAAVTRASIAGVVSR
jgi:hypothetical protein